MNYPIFFSLFLPIIIYAIYGITRAFAFSSFSIEKPALELEINKMSKDLKSFIEKYTLEDVKPANKLSRELEAQKISGYRNVTADFLDYCIIKGTNRLDLAFFLFDKVGNRLEVTINKKELKSELDGLLEDDISNDPSDEKLTSLKLRHPTKFPLLNNRMPSWSVIFTEHLALIFILIPINYYVACFLFFWCPIFSGFIISILILSHIFILYQLFVLVCLVALAFCLDLETIA